MRNFILIVIFSILSLTAYGQFYNDCAGATSNVDALVAFPHSEVGSILAGNTDDGTYDWTTAGNLTGPVKTAFYAFTVDADGYYKISFIASGSPAASGDLSVGWDPGSGTCPASETDIGDIAVGFDVSSDCVLLTAATTYYISMALEDPGSLGDFTITISNESIEVCEGATEVFDGDLLDNSCSVDPTSSLQGTIWSSYTVTGAFGPHVNVDITVTNGTLDPPSIYQVLLNDCAGDEQTVNATCLVPGDILYIETGDDSPNFGDYTINITESNNGVANDDCVDATDLTTLTCATPLTGAFDADACVDLENTCLVDGLGVWYTFDVAVPVTTFSFTGTEFQVFTGADCDNLVSLGCSGDAALDNVAENPGTIYWVLVYGAGDFTATSDFSVPANDLCGAPIALTSGTPEEGYNTCANPVTGFCTFDITSHAVYYSYTNGLANTVDLDIAVANSTASTGTSATDVGVAVITDACDGAPFNNEAPVCNTLDASFNIGCIDPGETVIIVVGSADGTEGDFEITVTENLTGVGNDVCDLATDLLEIPSSCIPVDFPGNDNTGACSDDFSDGGCDFTANNMHSVWYTFSTDANAELLDIVTDLSNASFSLYTGSCGSLSYVTGSCTTNGTLNDLAIDPNETYTLLIGSTDEGTFNISITVKNIPDNNLCADAELLVDGMDGTNACADSEYDFCAVVGTGHEVYFTYTNGNGANVDLNVTISGNTNTTGNATTGVDVAVITDACDGTLYNAPTNTFCGTLGTQFTIECIEDGETIILLVGSIDGEEGDFGISFTEDVSTVANDECLDAELLDFTSCVWENWTGYDNTDACFEDFGGIGACDYDTEPVVWFTFTATADATSVEFNNLNTAGTGFMGLFEDDGDCDNMTEADAGSGCLIAGAGPFGPFNITGGVSYLIAVGSSGGEGAIDFDMKVNESPGNDDPCVAGFAPIDLDDGVAFTDDNTCATFDFTSCGIVDGTAGKTLFYEHTMTQDADLEIIVAGTTAAGPFAIATYEGVACGDESQFIVEDCANNTLTIPCLLTGETIVIMIGTGEAAGEFGEYDITVNENTPTRPANDLCTDAEVITYEDTDLCKWVPVANNETNIDACSEDNDFGTACDYTNEEVVWYSFTAPPATDPVNAVLNIQFLNYTGTGDLFTTVFEDSGDCTALTPLSNCETGLGPHGALNQVLPNTTYLIGVGSSGDIGGEFEMEINITSGPPNDDACADLSAYDLTGGATLTDQTNACAGPGPTFPECSGDDQSNAVFYDFTITAPDYGINIMITASGSTPMQGTVVGGISATDTEFCTGTTYTPPAYCEDISVAEFEWDCLEPGSYQFKVSTSNDNSGTFDITATIIEKVIFNCNKHDVCDIAEPFILTEECDWVDLTGQCNVRACPDPIAIGACDLNEGPTVWYSIEIPTGAATLDVIVDNTSFGPPVMVVTPDCPPTTGWCSDAGTFPNPIDVTGEDGNTFYIGISDPTGDGGDFDLHVKIDVPPINDHPCIGNPRPPFDLGASGSHSGTTCCAIGANDDPGQDQANVDCNGSTDDNAVWYRAEGGSDGVSINVTGGSIGDNVAVEVYVGGPDAACDGTAEFRKSQCDGLPVLDMRIGCLDPDDYIFIKVTSTDEDCGTFAVDVTGIDDCDVADNCEDITGAQTLEPVTDPSGSLVYDACATGCLDLACPENPNPPGCDFTQNPTVWFQVETDADAAQLYSAVTTSGNWTPIWSVFTGDCSGLTNAAGTGSFACSGDAVPAAPPLITGVTEGTYYIAVTADPGGEPIDDPDFEICVATIITMVVCLGPDLGCAPEESLGFEIIDRENTEAEPDGPPYFGPFCPGEELTVNLTFEYDATQTGDDWLIGLIPKFGPAWDLEGFDYNSFAPTGNGRTAEWYEEDGGCAPLTMESFPFLCTYEDDDGNLHLFNTLCEYADPTPCTGGLVEDEPLPSGYFWVVEGGSPDCTASNCSPAYKYGIGNPVANITWNFTMKVKEFDNQQDCMDNNDLGISFMTFSDGGAGCWDDPIGECLIDKPQFSPPWLASCIIPPGVNATPQPQEICTGSSAGILVTTDDGSVEIIEVTFVDNPNVDGEHNFTFIDGFGTVDDVLTLNDPDACGPETVKYYTQVTIAGMVCEGKIDSFEVDVYPLPIIPEQDTYGACLEELPYSLPVEADCGYQGIYTFTWEDDLSGNTGVGEDIIIDETFGVGLHTFSITVTDGLGCENTGELQFNIYPSVEFKLVGDTLCWNEFHEFVPDMLGRETSDFEYYWTWNPGDGFDGDEETYEILEDEYGDVYQPGEYTLCLEVSEEHPDGVTCYKDTCINVWFRKPLNITIDPDPAYICDGQGCIDMEIIFDEENGLTFDDVVSISWNGLETNVPYNEYCSTGFAEWVDVVTAYGCDTTIYFDILPNDIENLEISGDTIICEGDSTTLTVVGDFVSYEWNTSPVQITKSITVKPTTGTTYEVSASNASGCVSAGNITVHVFNAEIPDLPQTVSFCTGFSNTVTAPAGYATYAWYKDVVTPPAASDSSQVTISTPGTYILIVTTAEGCSAQGSVIAIEDSELSPVAIGDFVLCFDEPTTLIKAIGGNFITYEWRYNDMNGDLINTDPAQDSVYLSDGKYYLFVEDANCAGDTTFTITRKPEILPQIIPNTDTIRICWGEDTTLVAPAGYYGYRWSTGSFNDTIFNVGKGKYFVTVTDNDIDLCTGVDSIYVKVYPKMYPALGDSVEICADETVWLYPGEFTDYEWSKDGTSLPFDGQDSIEVADGGVFSVIVYNEIGCAEFDTILVKKTDFLTPNITGIVDLCDDDEIILTSTGSYFKYTWTNSDNKVLSTDDTLRFTMTLGKNTETITLVVESATGCLGTDTKSITRYNSPVLDLKDEVLEACGRQSTDGGTILDFSIYFDVSDNTMGDWFDFDGSGATHNPDWSQVDFGTVDAGSTYRYVFTTNTAQAPCENISDTLYVTVIECLCDVWGISPISDVCNDAASLTIGLNPHIVDSNGDQISPPPAGTWSVTSGSSSPLSGTNFNPANAPSDVYTLIYTLTNQGNYCEPSHEVTVTVQNSVEPGEPNQDLHVCEGLDVLVRLDSMLVGEDAGGVWTEVSTSPSTGGVFDATAGTFSTAGQMPGTYEFNYRLIGVTPCPSADVDVKVVIDPVPVADAGEDVDVCFENKPVTLVASVADNYKWTKQGSNVVIGTARSLEVSESGVYIVRVETAAGCFDEDEVSVTIQPQIIVTISGQTLLQNGATDTLKASVIGRDPSDIRIYNWTKDGEPIPLYVDNFFPISEAGVYCVEVEDNDGCLGSDCESVSVAITKEIEVPNIFSPDEDGKNDRFFVKDGKNVKHIRTFKVFDRWGEMVFSDENFTFDERKDHFWDGTFNGKDAMQGVYVYLVEFTWSDDKEDFVAGDITLVR